MEVRPKKALGQHFLVDQAVARRIVAALNAGNVVSAGDGASPETKDFGRGFSRGTVPSGKESPTIVDVLEIGPGMGVLTQYLLERDDVNLKLVELDEESVNYLVTHFNGMQGRLYQADYLRLDIHRLFQGNYSVIGNFPYNISSQIFFKVLDDRDRIPEVVCMVQKEVAERIACGPGSKVYGILSVLLQAWYDIEYLFTVEPGAFAPPPKVRSAVIRLRRNSRIALLDEGGNEVEEKFFRQVVKSGFGQRRKTLRNALKPLLTGLETLPSGIEKYLPLRAEQLSVEDFIDLTSLLSR